MILLLETYRGGYKKAMLDLKNLIQNPAFHTQAKSKKQIQNLIVSFLDLVLQEPEVMEDMLETGSPQMVITKDCTCLPTKAWGKNKNRSDVN